MAQISNGSGIKRSTNASGNRVSQIEATAEERAKDIVADEDTWIGWDGPVWCSRYGRFENQEDASADDEYTIKGQPPHQDLGLERCEKHGLSRKVPSQHFSYVQDIQRRVEPMVASVVKLEHQVGALVHHLLPKVGNDITPSRPGFAERYDETTVRHVPDYTPPTDHRQHTTELMREEFWKLEDRVDSLGRQMHEFMHHQGHHNTENAL